MALRKHANHSGGTTVSQWSVADLSALYAEQRSSLVAQARRILRSDADAAEIVQEAFLKFILAAPELDSRDRALAYLRTTVNNLCLNVIRATGSRPNLVAIDSDTSQERLNEISAQAHIPFDASLAAAEDASIVREALARLTNDQRTALVMWEMEGRSTEEIASALGTTPANVRHVVGRARASFVRTLSEWIVDEANGTTALEALSSSYRKAAELAKKSSKAALSLIVLIGAFLGFSSIGHTPSTVTKIVAQKPTSELPAVASNSKPNGSSNLKPASSSPSSANSTPEVVPPKKSASMVQTFDAKIPNLIFAGLGKDGVPTGFTATDSEGHTGAIIVGKPAPILTSNGLILKTNAMTSDDAAVNVLLEQTLTVTGAGTTYSANPSITIAHSWTPLNISSTTSDIRRLDDGTYLVSATFIVDSVVSTEMVIPTKTGIDVTGTPLQIVTRIHLNATKSQILAQAIEVVTKGAK